MRISFSMYKFLQIVVFQVILSFKSSFSLFSPITVAFSPIVNLVQQYFIDFCPLIVCPCMWFCSAWSLCLWSWWILHGGHVHWVVHKARRCDSGGRGHNRHCKYSAVGFCINSTDMKCISISCWNDTNIFAMCKWMIGLSDIWKFLFITALKFASCYLTRVHGWIYPVCISNGVFHPNG